ncbi:MAG: hypothetical protein J6A37_17125 [Oscillospiraceae bacterium]|nr:hypothetical protein [Oscillospiraceae bacterium]
MKIRFHIPNFLDKFSGVMNITLINMIKQYPQMFYEGVEIASVFDCFPIIWNGGRVVAGYMDVSAADRLVPIYLQRFNSLGIPCSLTLTNPLITENELSDPVCNRVLELADNGLNEAIVVSPVLEEHIRKNHPNMKIISSTCKQIRDVYELNEELEKDYSLVVLDYNFNNDFRTLSELPHKRKIELLANAVCVPNCPRRGEHYRFIGEYQLNCCNYEELRKIQSGNAKIDEWKCPHMSNNAFMRRNSSLHISPKAIIEKYAPMGFENYKLEGRGNIFPDLAEQYVYYMAKPEYRDAVRYNLLCAAASAAGSGRRA